MSFDLGIWHSDKSLTDKQASEIYVNLCENWPYLEGETSSIATFYEELTSHWPEIDRVPVEEIDNLERCPWSCELAHSGMAVVTSCVFSMADEVARFVRELATKHALILFDPQSGHVSLPKHLG